MLLAEGSEPALGVAGHLCEITLPIPVLRADFTHLFRWWSACTWGSWEGSSSLGLAVVGGVDPHRGLSEWAIFSPLDTVCYSGSQRTKDALRLIQS